MDLYGSQIIYKRLNYIRSINFKNYYDKSANIFSNIQIFSAKILESHHRILIDSKNLIKPINPC